MVCPHHPYSRLIAQLERSEAERGERCVVFLVQREDGSGVFDQHELALSRLLEDPDCPFAEAVREPVPYHHVFVIGPEMNPIHFGIKLLARGSDQVHTAN